MWFGRVVPLLQFPLINRRTDRPPDASRTTDEERSMPLLNDLCLGMSIEDGTALYVTYGINTNPDKWGDDLAGWFAIAPFPPRLFRTDKLMHLGVHLKNQIGAFRSSVSDPITKSKSIFLYMEVLGTGDVGGLILRNPDQGEDEIKKTIKAKPDVEGIEHRVWKREKKKDGKSWWAQTLFQDIKNWQEDRRVLVREGHIVVPYGEFWYLFGEEQKRLKEAGEEANMVESFMRPNYCLLARDMELPILLALVPARPLFRIDMDVSIRETDNPDEDARGQESVGETPSGVGLLDRVVNHVSKDDVNIWHVHHTFRSLIFKPTKNKDEAPTEIRGADSHISIVASVPKKRGHDSPPAITSYLKNLRDELLELRLEDERLLKLQKKLESLPEELLKQSGDDEKACSHDLTVAHRSLRRLINSNFNKLKKEVLEPSFVRDVDIHGPPLFRCFLSHSASPAYDERDHITRLKTILEAEVFEVVEGEFSLGQSTEALSRGRIRHCDLFVSFLWPRENFRRADGTFSPPEWIIHEESFAIGQNMPVYRVIEETVENPRYEQDRPPFKFKKNDLDSWSNLERAFRLEVRELALRILLGAHMTATDKAGGRGEPL